MPILTGVLSIAPRGVVITDGGQSRHVVNSFSYENVAGPGPPFDLDLFAIGFNNQVWTPLVNYLPTDWLGDGYWVYADTQLAPPGHLATQTPPNGSVVGGWEPVSVCVALSFYTGLRGKNYRGIKRWGPVPSSFVMKDQLTPAARAAFQAQLNALLGGFTDPDGQAWKPVVLSRQLSSEGPPRVFVGAPVTSVVVSSTLGICRHRRERTVR